MKKLLMGAAFVALLASPAFAQSYDPDYGTGNVLNVPAAEAAGGNGFGSYAYAPAPRHLTRHERAMRAQAYAPADETIGAGDPDTVYAYGQYKGRDPDPNVRLELRRDDLEY